MSVYLVAYETKNGFSSREHQVLQGVIQRVLEPYECKKIMDTVWLIDSDDSAVKIRNTLKYSIRDASEYFKQLSDITVYVHMLARSNWATLNGSDIATWLKHQRLEQDYRHASYI